jgi:hypothetical protein
LKEEKQTARTPTDARDFGFSIKQKTTSSDPGAPGALAVRFFP